MPFYTEREKTPQHNCMLGTSDTGGTARGAVSVWRVFGHISPGKLTS